MNSFVLLGFDEAGTQEAKLDVYKEHSETPSLEATEGYYRFKSETFIAGHTIVDYSMKAKEPLGKEEDRAEMYPNASTSDSLICQCECVLTGERSKLVHENFQGLPEHDKEENTRTPGEDPWMSRPVDGQTQETHSEDWIGQGRCLEASPE